MVWDDAGLFFNESCQVSFFQPVSNRDDKIKYSNAATILANLMFFPLAKLQDATRKPNNCMYNDHHFFPMEMRRGDSIFYALLIDLFMTNKCFLYNCLSEIYLTYSIF